MVFIPSYVFVSHVMTQAKFRLVGQSKYTTVRNIKKIIDHILSKQNNVM